MPRGDALPRQRRHGDAPADRRARRAGGDAGRPLRAARRRPHARAADRRPGRRAAQPRLQRSTTWAPTAIRRCASAPARPAARAASSDPRARRCLEPVPDCAAARAAARQRRPRRRDRGRRRADLASPTSRSRSTCWRASASRSQRDGWRALHHPGRQPLPLARRASASKATRRRRRTSSPPARSRRAAAPLRIEGVGCDSIQGDIRFVDAARAMGARRQRGAGWLEVAARPLAAAADRRSTAATSPTRR